VHAGVGVAKFGQDKVIKMLYVYFATFALFSLIFTREVIAPASGATCDKRWQIYAGAMNASNFVMVVLAGILFETSIGDKSLLNLKANIGTFTGGLATFLVASVVFYGWHRLIHSNELLWRLIHQLHHSPQRIEALTSFYVHPLDSLTTSLLNAFVAYSILGVSAASAAIAIMLVTVFSLIAHADQKTPHWLGYFIQRPEMHRIHHQTGLHRNNYGLPILDMLFGTYVNPHAGHVECGFADGKAEKIMPMLLFTDVHK
jgi:sterol desaturase/sphingolipid hydroxylase (fatty acid hydroxylase superfamily)